MYTLDRALHALEKMKVLCPSRLPFRWVREWRNKEWWYTGVYDEKTGVYVSWYFIRVNLIDKFIMTVFDPKLEDDELPRVSRGCFLDRHPDESPGLDLLREGKSWRAHYRLVGDHRWQFDLRAPELTANIAIEQKLPPFTKFDNEIQDNYAVIHYFQSRGSGTVEVPGRQRYEFTDALVYQDHCYGRVPRRTGWNWLAVQSESIALASLVNYGAYAQRYSQVWMNDHDSPRQHQWVRLAQAVSFEHEDRETFKGVWRVTSTDLDLTVHALKMVKDRTRIPPLLPGFAAVVDLAHVEAFVKADGKVRVDGRWVDTQPMFGVMEQHEGRW